MSDILLATPRPVYCQKPLRAIIHKWRKLKRVVKLPQERSKGSSKNPDEKVSL